MIAWPRCKQVVPVCLFLISICGMLLYSLGHPAPAWALKVVSLTSMPEGVKELESALKKDPSSKPVELIMARGEGEPFLLGITDISDKSFTLKMKGAPNGDWLKVSAYRVGWISVKDRLRGTYLRADPLFPVPLGEPTTTPDVSTVLWVRPYIAASLPSKEHLVRFSLEIQAGQKVVEVPVSIKVANMTLPSSFPVTLQATLASADGQGGKFSPSRIVEAYAFLSEFGINSGAGAVDIMQLQDPSAFLTELFSKTGLRRARVLFINAKQSFRNTSSNSELMSQIPRWKASTQKTIELYKDVFRKHPNSLLVKLWDEPKSGDYTTVRDLYGFVESIREPFLTELTAPPKGPLATAAKIFIPRIDDLDPPAVRKAQAASKEVWFYANKMHSLRMPYETMRNIGWIMSAFNLDGYHMWCVNCWGKRDPYTSIITENSSRGYLVYPAAAPRIFNPSIRLAMFREGMEDYLILSELSRVKLPPTVASRVNEFLTNTYRERVGRKAFFDDPKPTRELVLESLLQ